MKKIYRNGQKNGWYIPERFGTQRRKFLDVDFGSQEQSYAAALRELEPDEPTHRKVETKSRSNKVSDTPVGITHYTVKDGNQIKHRFAVCNPGTGQPHIIYIGNDNTWQRNYDQKLVEAETLRDQFVEQYKERHA
uniref:Uncharacterized protein n=1 Tax=Pseudomonas phage HRDY3 TaxID=3236930 RepID=A0AB39CDI3_9VIRU